MRILQSVSKIVSLCLLMLFVLIGSAAAEDSGRNTVIAAYKKLADVKGYHMTLTGELSTAVQGKNIHSTLSGEMDILVQPLLCKNDMVITVNADGKQFTMPITQYVERVDKRIFTYIYAEGKWDRQSFPGNFYNPAQEFSALVKAIKRTELISDDENTAVYQVTADGKYLKEAIKNNLKTLGIKTNELAEISDMFLDAIGDLTYNITIDKTTGYISGVDMDLSELIAALGAKMADNLSLPENKKQLMLEAFNNTKMQFSYTLSQFDNVEAVTIPNEARGGNI